jgi:DNA-directed RNA polymerase specialized sigma24 family protein
MPGGKDIERLYDEHAQPLFAFLLNFTRDEADTRDLLQEIFIKLAREPKLLDGVREERAFLIRLAHNAAIDLIRRRRFGGTQMVGRTTGRFGFGIGETGFFGGLSICNSRRTGFVYWGY